MNANIAQPTATPTSSPEAIQPVPAALLDSSPACPIASCAQSALLMLCEVRSYRRGVHDDGQPRLIYLPERCDFCPFFERCA